jgi:hypothetical protein
MSRMIGQLDPTPADLAYAALALAALECRARRGERILLYEDETIVWCLALPRAGWWRKAQCARLPTRPLSQSQIKREESLKRQMWLPYRAWSRITSGRVLSVTSVPSNMVMVADRSGIHRFGDAVIRAPDLLAGELVIVPEMRGGLMNLVEECSRASSST